MRVHPLNDLLAKLVRVIPFFVLGFTPTVLAAYVPALLLLGILLHANVPWSFGPLRYLLVTPQFHHWHHTAQREALDRNFAIHLPLIDWLFDTYYLPKDVWPERYGIEGNPVPSGYLKQLVHPFRAARNRS